ncbi:hypothetical protein GCM10028895_08870 [Pontibacter rugosus]
MQDGAKLLLAGRVVRKATNAAFTSFTVMDGGMLGIGHIQGITTGASTGAIRTDIRNFSKKADYMYTGATAQVTGNALPTTVRSLYINAASTVELSQNQVIAEGLHLQAGSLKLGSRSLIVQGDLLVSKGGMTGSNNAVLSIENTGQRTVELPAVTLAKLTINSRDGVNMTGNVAVANELTMQKGILHTRDNAVVLAPTSILNESLTSYILGQVDTEHRTTEVNVPYTFSNVGLTLVYKGVAAGTTAVSRYTGAVTDKPNGILIDRTIKITTAVKTGLDASMSFAFMNHELKGLSADDLVLYRSTDDGVTYTNRGRTTVDRSKGIITLDGIDAFSRWAVGTDPSPLPVELMNFAAVKESSNIAFLTWATASENNNSHFEIERSANGKTWAKIGDVAGAGNSGTKRSYSFSDAGFAHAGAGTVYYRLKQVDFDGTAAFSKVVSLQQATGAVQRIERIVYNPSTQHVIVNYANMSGQPIHVILVNLNGAILLNKTFATEAGKNELLIPLAGQGKGLVVAKAAAGNTTLSTKFIR